VAVSSFEFLSDFDRGCREIERVLRSSGAFFLVTPGDSPILDFGLRVLTGADADRDYGDRRKDVIPALLRHFRVEKSRAFPMPAFPIYRGFKLVRS